MPPPLALVLFVQLNLRQHRHMMCQCVECKRLQTQRPSFQTRRREKSKRETKISRNLQAPHLDPLAHFTLGRLHTADISLILCLLCLQRGASCTILLGGARVLCGHNSLVHHVVCAQEHPTVVPTCSHFPSLCGTKLTTMIYTCTAISIHNMFYHQTYATKTQSITSTCVLFYICIIFIYPYIFTILSCTDAHPP